jgi:hypothetical protein
MGRRGIRHKRLSVSPRETRRCWNLKEEALYRTLCGTVFLRGYEPVVRQVVEWMMNECNYITHTLRLLTAPCHIQAWRAYCVSMLSIKWYCGLKHVELYKGTPCLIYCIFLHLLLTRVVKNIVLLPGKRNISPVDQLCQLSFFIRSICTLKWKYLENPEWSKLYCTSLCNLVRPRHCPHRQTSASIYRLMCSKNF